MNKAQYPESSISADSPPLPPPPNHSKLHFGRTNRLKIQSTLVAPSSPKNLFRNSSCCFLDWSKNIISWKWKGRRLIVEQARKQTEQKATMYKLSSQWIPLLHFAGIFCCVGENANIHELLKSYLVAREDGVFGHRVFESKLPLSKRTHPYTLLLIKNSNLFWQNDWEEEIFWDYPIKHIQGSLYFNEKSVYLHLHMGRQIKSNIWS